MYACKYGVETNWTLFDIISFFYFLRNMKVSGRKKLQIQE